jgi:hypothetical protein
MLRRKKMNKNTVIFLILTLLLTVTGTAFASENPFIDVPADHWAYGAINQLHKAGIIEGSKGQYAGDKALNRYEMAQIVAKAMGKADKADASTKEMIRKLAAEFSEELKSLGVRVTALEKSQPKIKFSGAVNLRYNITNYQDPSSKGSDVFAQYRLRLDAVAKVDDKTSVGLRFVTNEPNKSNLFNDTWQKFGENAQSSSNLSNIDRVYFITKVGAVDTTVGRQSFAVDRQGVLMDPGAFSFDGVKAVWKLNDYNFTANYGRFLKGAAYSDATKTALYSNLDIASLTVGTKTGKLDWSLGYFNLRNPLTDKDAIKWSVAGATYYFTDKLSVNTVYAQNDGEKIVADKGDNVWAAKIIAGDQAMNKKGAKNFVFHYVDKKANAFVNNFSMLTTTSGLANHQNIDFKLFAVQYNYAFSNSFNTCLEYARIDPAKTTYLKAGVETPNDSKKEQYRIITNLLF